MSRYEVYQAQAHPRIALARTGTTSPYTIEVRFLGGLSQPQKDAFAAAADRWCRMIIGDLPAVTVDGEVIDDLVVLAQGSQIDGPGGILGQAGPTHVRPASAGRAAYLPAKGTMNFDTADLAQMEQRGTLADVITHEMGHVLGFGTVWNFKRLLKDAGTINPTFLGHQAMEEYGTLRGSGPASVPVENMGGAGTRDCHWREVVFQNELMTGYISSPGNPISRMTVGSLEDLGYDVHLDSAEPYSLASLRDLAERGLLMTARGAATQLGALPTELGTMLPSIPIILPDESLEPPGEPGAHPNEREPGQM